MRWLGEGLRIRVREVALRTAHRGAVHAVLCIVLGLGGAMAAATPPAPSPAPPAQAKESAAAEALRLARAQGMAESAIVDWVLANSGPLKGDLGAGEYRVAFTVTPAEGWWDKSSGGKLAWHDAPANQVHLRVFVVHNSDGTLANDVDLAVTLIDENGNEQPLPVAFGWYPLINAYGGNIAVADGSYRLRVRIASPVKPQAPLAGTGEEMARGEGLARTVVAEFPAVAIVQNEAMLLPLATLTGYSKEAELLKPCNAALRDAITALWRQSATGAEKADGEYFVAYALDESTPSMALRARKRLFGGSMEDVRLEVLVRDARTGRLIPTLAPTASLVGADGGFSDGGRLIAMRHPWLSLYGRGARLVRRSAYKLRVSFDAPGFRRWGRQSERFALPSEVEFDGVSLKPESGAQGGSAP